MTTIRDLDRWYWFFTVGLLGTGLLSGPAGIYLAMLIAGSWEPLQWIHWIQLAGTTARMLVGYGLLSRALSLAPWNRRGPLSFATMRLTFLSPQTTVPPCGDVFRRMSLERVQG